MRAMWMPMELTLPMVLIVAVGVFLASFMDGIAGGGGIISVPTYFLAGLPAHLALGTNKLSSCIGTAVSTGRFIRSGYVNWKLGVPSIVLALVGAALGTRLQLMVSERALQILLLAAFLGLWELSARLGWVDAFIVSSPSRVVHTLVGLQASGELWLHVGTSCLEVVVGFVLGTLFGTLIAIGLWWSELLSRVLDPYLVVLNALPKTALGPVFIVWIGAGTESIIAMTIAISIFVTILNMHVGFLSTDREKIRLMQTLGATRHQILWRLVIPANYATLFNTLRVNVGLSWVGVIMGEFLVSKAGLGYLIVYGSQVFNMDLVMATVLVLAVAAVVMYQLVLWLEKIFKNRLGVTQ